MSGSDFLVDPKTPAVESRRLARCDSAARRLALGERLVELLRTKQYTRQEGRGARARNSNESESVRGRSCTGTMELAKSAAKEG